MLLNDTFGEGPLVSLNLMVPVDYEFRGSIFIAARPDTIANGFDEIPTTAGERFELIVIPEPSTWIPMLTGIFAVISSRRLRDPDRRRQRKLVYSCE